jgi:hypothetical protein
VSHIGAVSLSVLSLVVADDGDSGVERGLGAAPFGMAMGEEVEEGLSSAATLNRARSASSELGAGAERRDKSRNGEM